MFDSYLPCADCSRATNGRCWQHSQWTNAATYRVVDNQDTKIVSDHGPDLRRIADALEALVAMLKPLTEDDESDSNQRGSGGGDG